MQLPRFLSKSFFYSLLIALAAMLAGCGGNNNPGGGGGGGGKTLQSIKVTPANPTIAKGLMQQFTATATFSDGSTQDVTATVTWTSSNTAVVTITAGGLATGVGVGGPITITAASQSVSVNGTTGLTIGPAALVSIAVTPPNLSIGEGGTQQFTATGHFTDNSTQNLAGSVTWMSQTPSVATIDANTGLATAVSPGGPINITAIDGAVNGATGLTVTLPVPRFAFLSTFGTNIISVYAIDANSGQLRANGNVINPSTGMGTTALTTHPSGNFLYGADQSAGTGAIDGYSISASGGLTQITGLNPLSASTAPTCVAIDPTGKFLYVSANGIRAYSIDSSTGALTQLSGSPFSSAITCVAIAPGGKFLFGAHSSSTAGSNTVTPFPVNSDGTLGSAGTAVATGGTNLIEMAVSPSANLLYVTDTNGGLVGDVAGFSFDAGTGALTAVSGSPFATDTLIAGITTDIAGKFVYVSSEGKGMDAFSIGAGGTLSKVTGSPFASSNPTFGGYIFVAADSSGKFLFGESNSGFTDTLSINSNTGALTINSTMVTLGNTQGITLSHGGFPVTFSPKFIYAANTTDNTVSGFAIDPTTGALTAVSGSPFSAGASTGPKMVVADLTGKFLFTANNAGSISAFTIGGNGGLTAVSGSPFSTGGTGTSALFVDPSDRFLYASNATSNNVSEFALNSSGVLTLQAGFPKNLGNGPMGITMDPSGSFLFIADTTDNNLREKIISPGSGAISPASGEPFATGNKPQAVALDGTGNFVYIANTMDGTLSAYIVASDGLGLSATITGQPFTVGKSPTAVTSDPKGRFLYVANSGDNNVSAFKIGSKGVLTAITGSPFSAGTGPNSVFVDGSGTFLLVANSGSNNISVFSIDQTTGALTPVAGSPFGAGSGTSSVSGTTTVQ